MPAVSRSPFSLFHFARRLYTMTFPLASIPGWEHTGNGSEAELYFAYGSNMAVEQMARRCPTSVFAGMGLLNGFRWQINQRGVANIVRVADAATESLPSNIRSQDLPYVEGLVYWVKPADKQSLDRSEGVQQQLYEKHYLTVDVQEIDGYTGRLCTQLVPELAQTLRDSLGAGGRPAPTNKRMATLQADTTPAPSKHTALVYISGSFTQEGLIRNEYIARMNSAIKCGVTLGMSPDYVSEVIVPYLIGGDASDSVKTRTGPPCKVVARQRLCERPTAGPANAVLNDDGDKMHVDGPVAQVSTTTTEKPSEAQKTESEKATTATTAVCGTPECNHHSPLCELRIENRKPHRLSGTRFDDAIFDRLRHAQISSIAGKDNDADVTDKRTAPARERPNVQLVYVVVMEEPPINISLKHATGISENASDSVPRVRPGYSVEASAKTMMVAAELALRYFRDSLARLNVPVDGGVIGPPVLDDPLIYQVPGAADKIGKCICVMGDSSLNFSVQLSQSRGGGSIKTWITPLELYDWE
ncbi:aig2 family protein [Ophiostoma piceae UAMH 11346]|uniref:gamma-glutamylcyclotransferase n=1 Tax=Ophiostoma piceae (strain UAMH 11346) TaxID=1262450 RepID=S3C5I0_OPHP1|nr:aig2 family protein [Ophiostoma piceae UAMH 11346]